MKFGAIVAVLAALVLLAIAVVEVKKPGTVAATPEAVVQHAIDVLNLEGESGHPSRRVSDRLRNLDSVLTSLEPAKGARGRDRREKMRNYIKSEGVPWNRFLDLLPGLEAVAGNTIPDRWTIGRARREAGDEREESFIVEALSQDPVVPGKLTARILLRRFGPAGWRIVDCRIIEGDRPTPRNSGRQ